MAENSVISGDESLARYLDSARRRYPYRVAIRDRDRTLTYAQLDHMSNALAQAFHAAGVTAGHRVGIWLNKSAEAVVGVYATLRAGCAYVPIDPTAPVRRAAHVISDSKVSCLLTTPDRVAALGPDGDALRSCDLLLLVGQAPADDPMPPGAVLWDDVVREVSGAVPVNVPAAPGDLAYVLYTSGSTGAPKGVMLTHRNGRAFVEWAAAEFALRADDVMASHAPLHFDLSVFDIFGAAAAGGCLALVPDSVQGSGDALVRFVADQHVSVWYSVPGALRRMATATNSALLGHSQLRIVAFAGEVYHTSDLRTLRTALPAPTVMYNLYGPTETNVCTYHRIGDRDLASGAPPVPPIGLPCPYADVRLLDAETTVSAGDGRSSGELCVSGDSVMAGYWNDPVGTRLRFTGPDGSYYRTGDIVRRDRAGRFFFAGRRDDMVKVKGYRVELGEIEAVLSGHPEVAEAACLAILDAADSAREPALVAFVALAPSAAANEAVLRRHCAEFLPRYMVPRIVLVTSLARTSTGKVDRQLLTAMAIRGVDARY